ncbi:hypothetical protein EJB05_37551, partial [Eragrostis curvula]
MDAVLASPATRQLEELRLSCAASLRVLDLAAYKIGPPASAVFGRLDTLILTWCESTVDMLQAVLDAAPSLATLRLDGFSFTAAEGEELSYDCDWYAPAPATSKRRVLLRCPRSVASLALLHCHGTDGLYLDAPGVLFLRYKGFLEHFPFNSATTPPSGESGARGAQLLHDTVVGLPSFKGRSSSTAACHLKLLNVNDIAVHPEQEDTYLKEFPELKFLEVKGSYEKDKHGAAVALANFLHYCPAVQELRLKFKVHGDLYVLPDGIHLSEERKAQLEEFNYFEVKIAKFLVEIAIVLEKMEVHNGHQRVHDHIHRKLAIWRAHSSNSKIDIVGGQELRMLTHAATAELTLVSSRISSITLSSTPDKRRSPLIDADNKLHMVPIYRLLMAGTDNSCDYAGNLWQNCTPPRVQFFTWLLVQGRIKCCTTLLTKHVVNNATCELCSNGETADHLLLQCPTTTSFWQALNIQLPASISSRRPW